MKLCLGSLLLLTAHVAATRTGSIRFHSRLESSFLDQLAQDCACTFSGTCACGPAMEFMNCIDAACQSGQCQCKHDGGDHYKDACGFVDTHCPSIGMTCDASPSTCGAAAASNASAAAAAAEVPVHVHKEKVQDAQAHGHHLFAALFLFLFFATSIKFAMVNSSNEIVAKNTWSVLDSVAVTSMAITTFYLVTHIFDELTAGAAHWKVTMHVVWALTILFVAMFGSYALRGEDNKVAQASFNAVMYWMCLLAKGGTLSTAQSELAPSMTHVFMITAGALLFFVVLILITHQIKPADGWYDAVETNLAGGALAAGVVSAVHLLINGIDHTPNKPVDASGTMMFNVFALITCVAAVVLTPVLGRMKAACGTNKDNYWYLRFLTFVDGFVGIMPYFTVSVGSGVLVCHLIGAHPGTVIAKLVSAATAVFYGYTMIVACAYIPYFRSEKADVKALAGLILGFGGYIAGYAIAALLTGTIDQIVQGRDLLASEKTQIKMGIIAIFNAVLIPVYVIFLKPVVIQKTS